MDDDLTAPEGPVVLSFELTYAEASSFFRWYIARVYRLRISVVMALIVVVFGIVALAVPKVPLVVGIVVLFIGLFQLLLYAWMLYAVPGRAWKKGESTRSPLTLVFSDDGVGVHTNYSDAQNRWTLYKEALERDDAYLLRVATRRAYTIVPKRAFRSPSDEERFRTLVRSHTAASF